MARRRPFYTELLAYLTLRPRGSTVDEIADAFILTPARVRTDMKVLRDWLGADPRTGTRYLPDARTTPAAQQRGMAVYQVDGVLCDLHLFDRLVRRADTGPAEHRMQDLLAASGLVTGQPFDQLRPAGWHWLLEGDRLDLHATHAVSRVTVEIDGYVAEHTASGAAEQSEPSGQFRRPRHDHGAGAATPGQGTR